jgi:hypothetical protein
MINRAALLLTYKKPAFRWVNAPKPGDPNPELPEESVNTDRTVYLIPEDAAASSVELEKWLQKNYSMIFENELFEWYVDETLWPENRSYAVFKEWFEVECHTVIEDLGQGELLDDDY